MKGAYKFDFKRQKKQFLKVKINTENLNHSMKAKPQK